jgi:DNA-binding LacI/PurR family transcriptional regulator
VSSTLRDVAQMAGVSTATVSRVINGAANVSSGTRSKVLSAIPKLKYIPDVHAVELRRGKGGIPRKQRQLVLSSTRTGTEPHSDPRARALSTQRSVKRMRLLEEENARLKRLFANLCLDVEMWKRIAH